MFYLRICLGFISIYFWDTIGTPPQLISFFEFLYKPADRICIVTMETALTRHVTSTIFHGATNYDRCHMTA